MDNKVPSRVGWVSYDLSIFDMDTFDMTKRMSEDAWSRLPGDVGRELGRRSRMYLEPGENGRRALDWFLGDSWVTLAGIVGENVRSLREEAGLTRAELGLILELVTGDGWGEGKVGSLERGRWPSQSPYKTTLDEIYFLALVFQHSIIEMLQVPQKRRGQTLVVLGGGLSDQEIRKAVCGFVVPDWQYRADFFTSPQFSVSEIDRDLDERIAREGDLVDQVEGGVRREPSADLKKVANAIRRERKNGVD